MAQINNKEVLKLLQDGANIQIAKEAVPNQLAEKIVPVFETNPTLLRRQTHVYTVVADNQNLVTVPAGKKFLICSAQASGSSVVGASGTIGITKDGAFPVILSIDVPAAAGGSAANAITFNPPIELNAGELCFSGIGVLDSCCYSVSGYYEEVNP